MKESSNDSIKPTRNERGFELARVVARVGYFGR